MANYHPSEKSGFLELTTAGFSGLMDCDAAIRAIFNPRTWESGQPVIFSGGILSARITVPLELVARWPNKTVSKATFQRISISEEPQSNSATLTVGSYAPEKIAFAAPNSSAWIVAECKLGKLPQKHSCPLTAAFLKHLGTVIIPYDIGERRAKFEGAFRDLKDSIERFEELKIRRASA